MTQKKVRRKFFDTKVQYDWWLLGAVAMQCIIGLTFLASALANKEDFMQEFSKQLVLGLWIGGIIAFIFSRLDYHLFFQYRQLIIGLTFVLIFYIAAPLLLADLLNLNRLETINYLDPLPFSPYMANAAVRWISFLGITFQPSELAKLSLLIYFASYLNQYAKEKFSWDLYKKPLYALVIICGAIVIQPDLGSVVMIVAIVTSALWIAKIPLQYIVIGGLGVALIASTFVFSQEWRRERVFVWLSQSVCQSYSPGSWNYDLCESLEIHKEISRDDQLQVDRIQDAIISGGLFGVGYSRSDAKSSIPEATNDGIIGVIGAEGGFFLVSLVIVLYLIIFLRGLKIASEAEDVGGQALATGISVWIILQSFWNIAGMVGLFPLKGLPLPFISEGGTAMLINLATIGILLSISTRKNPEILAQQKLQTKTKQRTVSHAR